MRSRAFAALPVRLLHGALASAVFGCVCVAVGFVRFCAAGATAAHASEEMARDARMLALYVGGFALAGAFANAAQPLLPGKAGTYVRFAIGGMIVMLMIAIGDKGSLQALDISDFVIVPVLGVLFGCAFAHGFTRNETDPPPPPPEP